MTRTTPSASIPVRRYGSLLGRYLAPQAGVAALLAGLLLTGIGLQLAVPQVLRRFIDTATGVATGSLPRTAGDGLVGLALVFLALALGTQLLNGAASVLGATVGWTATNLLRRDLLAHVLRLDMTFHATRTPGELIERIDGDVTALSDFFAQFAVRVVGGVMLLVGILVVLWWENPWVGAALTAFTLLEFVVMVSVRSVAIPATVREREATARLFGFVEERLSGLEDVRANGGGAHALYRLQAVMRRFFTDTRRAWLARSTIWLAGYGLFALGMLVTIGSSIQLVITGAITLGTAYMVFQYLILLQAPIEGLTQQLQVLQRAGASLGRVDALLAERSRLRAEPEIVRHLPAGALEVRFEGVGFRYHDAPPGTIANLRDIDLTLPAGRHLGLLGRTGSGKTTLTRLLFRFYDPSEGRVPLAELRRRVGLVTQEVQLFGGSVRQNLTFFDDTVPDDALRAALVEVGLGDWLASLPAGLDTPLHAGGGRLSAGQAQLLAMARVFLSDPGLIVLDEPSSRLDPVTEALLQKALARLLQGRTAVIIAHRLDTVERVDAIAVLEDGVVVEHGPRDRLASRPTSRYARLLRTDRDSVAEALEDTA
jgi:ATP-binding cassette, subfamily B, bacterial